MMDFELLTWNDFAAYLHKLLASYYVWIHLAHCSEIWSSSR